MMYKIRYCQEDGSGTAEMAVEASSPTEALVKFHHIRGEQQRDRGPHETITSVRADDERHHMPW